MELSKRKYKKQEVLDFATNLIKDFNHAISSQKDMIVELTAENKNLKQELEYYKEKEGAIVNALKSAEQKAIDTNKATLSQYNLTVRTLEDFISRFSSYFEALKEKYPLYPVVNEALAIKNELEKLLSSNSTSKEIVEKTDKELKKYQDKNQIFNPKKKINEYIVANGDSGFNIDEVLNPGELVLEDLCKELGLTEDN